MEVNADTSLATGVVYSQDDGEVADLPPITPALEQEYAETYQELQALKFRVSKDVFAMGKLWSRMHKGLWRCCGSHVRSFPEYCEKETNMSYETVMKWIRITDIFGGFMDRLEPGHPPIEHTRLIKLLPLLKSNPEDTEKVEEWFHSAINLNKKDFNRLLQTARGKNAPETCSHPPDQQRVILYCKDCGEYRRLGEKPTAA